MPSQDSEPCLICGVETKNRCSSCQEAGVDLFFCSPDHQRLVWKAHKPHCGPGKANPFRIEPLSDADLANLQVRAVLPITGAGPYCFTTIAGDLIEVSGKPFPYVFEHLGGPVTDSEYLRHKPFLVNMVRNSVFADFAFPGLFQMRSCAEFTDHFAALVLSKLCHCDWTPADLTTTTWFTPFHHKLVVLASLTTQVVFREGAAEKLAAAARWLPEVRARTTRWVRDGMGTGDPKVREAVRNVSFDYQEAP
ncbi:hypothetical protein JCM9279_004098 [Rhodotorula babjevae]